ncbi:hypothetical protein B7463_g2072, partial [Scytalidium lignicola]
MPSNSNSRQQAAEKALVDQTNLLPFKQLIIVFTSLSISLLITFVDQNGISVTLPTIAKELNAKNTISWAGTSSLIANTMFSVLYGRLSDIFGRKIMYLMALLLLCIADLLCGFSQNAAMFYVTRGLAGIAGGGVTSLTMIIVSDIVTLRDRGKYQGILGSCVGLGNVIGPFIGAGFVIRSTWRGMFWLISPLSALCALVGYFLIPATQGKADFKTNLKRIDFYGTISSSIAIILLLIPISGGGSYFQWNSPLVISMLIIGSIFSFVFIFVEWKVAALPMIPMSFFKNSVISALFVQSFLLGAVYQAYLYYLPLYYQNARGWTPLQSAAMVVPMVVIQSMSSIAGGQYISRMRRYGELIWFGFGIWTLGCGLTLLFTRHTHPVAIAFVLACCGVGIGLTLQPTLIAFQAHCTLSKRAVVISDRNFFRCLGGSCGLAVSAAILQATLKISLPENFKYLAHSSYSLPAQSSVSPADWEEILDAYMKASHGVFLLQVPLIGLCFLACIFLRDRGLERPKEPGEDDDNTAMADSKNDIENQNTAADTTRTISERISESTLAQDRHDEKQNFTKGTTSTSCMTDEEKKTSKDT